MKRKLTIHGTGIRTILLAAVLLATLSGRGKGMKEFLPAVKTKVAIIVCPGGSYCWLSKKTEGTKVAQWLNTNGIAAYVLCYPTAGWAAFAYHSRWFYRGHQYPDQINALNEALRKVRGKGYQYVGVMGFSAGGHLVLNAAEYSPKNISPDFTASIYPVVTLSAPCVHKRSRRGLLGEYRKHNRKLCDSLSMEQHADRITCPVFLINCQDDPIVNFHNSELMDSALTVNRKPHFYRQFATGGHGFGTTASRTTPEAITWKSLFLKWLRQLKIIDSTYK